MTADWVAVAVRGRGLLSRRLGRAETRLLASSTSLEAAVAELARTPYGRDVRVGMDLRAAQHAVFATLIWHLRILAGWAPPGGGERVRALAAGFEIANVTAKLAQLGGRPAGAFHRLGALGIAWPRIESARTPADVRSLLAASPWGDPGNERVAEVRNALHAVWARRVCERVPEARAWAAAFTALLVARALAAGAAIAPKSAVHRHIGVILGPRWASAVTIGELATRVSPVASWALDGVERADELWRAEARWWAHVEAGGLRLCGQAQPDAGLVVGFVALLAADAWRVRGSLEVAARGGRSMDWFDAVA